MRSLKGEKTDDERVFTDRLPNWNAADGLLGGGLD